MILEKLLISDYVYQITTNQISPEDLREILKNRQVEVPVVLDNIFFGTIQRQAIFEHLILHQDFSNMTINKFLLKPDRILFINDTNDVIMHKINSSKFRILPVLDANNVYISSLNVSSIQRALINEQDYIIHQYETMFTGIENPN